MPDTQSERGVSPTRIPQNMEAATQLIRGTNTIDLLITVVVPMLLVAFLMYTNILPVMYAVGSGALVLVGNYFLFRFLPNQASIIYWIMSIVGYLRSPNVMTKHGLDPEEDVEIEFLEENTGGRDPANGGMFEFIEVDEKTKELTLVDEIDIETGVVKLTDGSFVAGVEVGGMGMMLADRDMQMNATETYKRSLNSLNFPITAHTSSREFDLSSVVDRYEERLDDTDIQERPIMSRVMKTRKQFILQQIKPLGMNTKRHSVIIRASYDDDNVDDDPFDFTIIDPDSPVGEWLRENGYGGITGEDSVEEELVRKVLDRAQSVRSAISQNRNLDTEIMSGDELANTLRYFWRRESVEESEWQPASPIVTGGDGIDPTDQMQTGFENEV